MTVRRPGPRPGEEHSLEGDSVHGGVGPYAPTNDTAYDETSGPIGNVICSWRMLLATGEPRFADMMERSIYNSAVPRP